MPEKRTFKEKLIIASLLIGSLIAGMAAVAILGRLVERAPREPPPAQVEEIAGEDLDSEPST